MKKKFYKNLNLKYFETKEKNDADIAQEDKKTKASTKNNPRSLEEFYQRYRHVI